jgi:hypothetical protein
MIDRHNAERHRLIEAVDARVLTLLAAADVRIVPDAPPASESPGAILDRCSIAAIRIWHRAHAGTAPCAPPIAEQGNGVELDAIRAHRADLLRCLADLADDVIAGRRRFAAHRSFTSYRDAGAALFARDAP